MWYGSTKGYDLTVFPTAQMMYPAAGVTDGSGMQYVKEWIAMFQNALPINYFFVFIAFFGEEYGWRYYLQPVLQKRFGLRAGMSALSE